MAEAATFEIYQDASTRYRWRLKAPNHRITADSGYSYDSVSATRSAIATVKSEVASAVIVDLTEKK